jgi:hypothetical protein
VLTQQRLLDIVSRLPEADGFALAGGAALILRGTVDRSTIDLDFFIGHADVEADTIARMVAAVERALSEDRVAARGRNGHVRSTHGRDGARGVSDRSRGRRA